MKPARFLTDNCSILYINSGNTLTDPTYEFIRKASAKISQFFHQNTFFLVFSDQCDLISGFYLWYICHIHHKLIHTDTSENRRSSAMDQYPSLSGQRPGIPVSISHWDRCDPCGTFGYVSPSITDLSSWSQVLYIGNTAFKLHIRTKPDHIPLYLV